MKFTCAIDIDLPVHRVQDLFLNPDNLEHWQDGFKCIEHLSGTPGKVDAKSKIVYKNLELIETIINNDLPDEFKALYEHKSMVNTMTVQFEPLETNKTRYFSEIEYTKFIGVMPKLMAKLFPGLFRKQVLKWMNQFKTFAEKEVVLSSV